MLPSAWETLASSEAAEPPLQTKHAKYWQRCFKSFLPSQYTPSESTRLMWASFILAAHDMLSLPITAADRQRTRTWILSLQHPDGGFCGSPTHLPPPARGGDAATFRDSDKGHANLAATFFALITLAMAADSTNESEVRGAFTGVNRGKLLRWLRKLQRRDGSFGQCLWDGQAVGGSDTRHSYLACSIRWMLRGDVRDEVDSAWVDDIDVDGAVTHIHRGQTYDGGLAEFPQNESHAGYVYCAVAALSLLDRPTHLDRPTTTKAMERGIPDRERLLRFLAGRQHTYLEQEEQEEEDLGEEGDQDNYVEAKMGSLDLDDERRHVGFNGRLNKKADTCYTWWVAGTLAMLDSAAVDMIDKVPSRRFLHDITQHQIGGYGKTAGTPPDIFHSYLGLMALAALGEKGLKDIDMGLCCTKETTDKIVKARDGLVTIVRGEADDNGWDEDGFWDAL